MGLVNTSRSIYKQPEDIGFPSIGDVPEGAEWPLTEDTPDDESSEGDPDREGNTDPGTNVPVEGPEDVSDPELPATGLVQAVRVQSFKYLTIGSNKGMFHITGINRYGEPFTETVDAGPNLTVFGIVKYLSDIVAAK